MLVFAFAFFVLPFLRSLRNLWKWTGACTLHWLRVYWVNSERKTMHFSFGQNVGAIFVQVLLLLHCWYTWVFAFVSSSSFFVSMCKYLHARLSSVRAQPFKWIPSAKRNIILCTFLTNDSKKNVNRKCIQVQTPLISEKMGLYSYSRCVCVCVQRAHKWKWENICREHFRARIAHTDEAGEWECAGGEIVCY